MKRIDASLVCDETAKIRRDRFELVADPLFFHLDPFSLASGLFCQPAQLADVDVAREIVSNVGRECGDELKQVPAVNWLDGG